MSKHVEKARRLQKSFFDEIQGYADEAYLYDNAVAAQAGVSTALYSMMKNGRKSMSLNSMIRIAAVFNRKVTLAYRQQ